MVCVDLADEYPVNAATQNRGQIGIKRHVVHNEAESAFEF